MDGAGSHRPERGAYISAPRLAPNTRARTWGTRPYANFGNPQSLNLYSYVKNNPTTLADPDGHCTVDGEKHWGWCLWHTLGIYQTKADIHRQATQDRKTLSGMNLFINGQPAEDWVNTATDQQVIDEQRRLVEGLLSESCPMCAPGASHMSTVAGVLLPPGMTTSDFGGKVMKWGTGDEAARERIGTLTKEELERSGVTKEMAKGWRDFYREVKEANRNNPSAAGREELMQRAYELLGGKD